MLKSIADKLLKVILLIIKRIFFISDWRKKTNRAVVIFYTGKLGDIVCLTPVLKAIKLGLKDHELVFIGRKPFLDILSNNPYIDQMIGFAGDNEVGTNSWISSARKKLSGYDIRYYFNLTPSFDGAMLGLFLPVQKRICLTTHHDGKSYKLISLLYERRMFDCNKRIKDFYLDMVADLGLRVEDGKNSLYIDEPPNGVNEFFNKHLGNARKIVGIIPGSGKEFKQWPIEYWVKLSAMLIDASDCKIIAFGSKKEEASIIKIKNKFPGRVVDVIGAEIKDLPYYLNFCDLFIGVDTGLIYIADALGVPVVDILGPCDENTQSPENDYILVTDRRTCRPLSKIFINPSKDQYPEVRRCFQSLTPEIVFSACEKMIKNKNI